MSGITHGSFWVGIEPIQGLLGTVLRGLMYVESLAPDEAEREHDLP
jgi:hypothetical protein